jgi:hypothetical protein
VKIVPDEISDSGEGELDGDFECSHGFANHGSLYGADLLVVDPGLDLSGDGGDGGAFEGVFLISGAVHGGAFASNLRRGGAFVTNVGRDGAHPADWWVVEIDWWEWERKVEWGKNGSDLLKVVIDVHGE